MSSSTFAKLLAHTEKKKRDKAVNRLRKFVSSKQEWTDLDVNILWKSLFYCFWMSDKTSIQHELAENISKITQNFSDSMCSVKFVSSFFRTLGKEWHGIDSLRLDKYYMLTRKMLRESLIVMQRSEWKDCVVNGIKDSIEQDVILGSCAGVRLHVIDIWVEELMAVDFQVKSEHWILLLQPFINVFDASTDVITLNRIANRVLKSLLPEKENDVKDNHSALPIETLVNIQNQIFTQSSQSTVSTKSRSILLQVYAAYKESLTNFQGEEQTVKKSSSKRHKDTSSNKKQCVRQL